MAAPKPSAHSGFGSIGLVEGFTLAHFRVGQLPDPGRGLSGQQGSRDRLRAGWTVARRRAVGGSNVGVGEELKVYSMSEMEVILIFESKLCHFD